MATKTVLQYVQACLSTMDSDEVDGINETAESMQVANLLADCYDELLNRQEWEFLKGPLTFTAMGDSTQPTGFTIPPGLRHVHNLWYNVDTSGGVTRRELKYVEPERFLLSFGGGSAQSNKLLVTLPNQLQFYVRIDQQPTVYTTFDDKTIYCNAVDQSVEATLVSSKVSALGVRIPAFQVADQFVPDIPEHMVPLLQATLNSVSHLHFKQQASVPDEARVRRQMQQARYRNSKVASRENYYSNAFGRR